MSLGNPGESGKEMLLGNGGEGVIFLCSNGISREGVQS